MKVIFLEAVQDYGGARLSTLELAKRMQNKGHEILIVDCWGLNEPFNKKVEELGLSYIILDNRDNPLVITNKSKIKTLKNTLSYIPYQLKYRMKFRELADKFQPDIVAVNNIKCLSILDSKSNYKIDFFVRTWFAHINIPIRSQILLKKYKPRFLTVSQSSRQAVYTGGLSRLENIKVLHSVIDENVFKSFSPSYKKFDSENPIKILHSGGFLPTKGQDIAINIAYQLKQIGIKFKLVLTGVIYHGDVSKQYFEEIKGLIKKYELENDVEIVVNKHNVIEYFKSCDVLIHPSSTEGLPRVALEALCFGKPVIANPVGGVTDVILHNYTGFLTEFNDIQQYVYYISRYFNDYSLYKQHSIQGKSLIEQNYLSQHQEALIAEIYPI